MAHLIKAAIFILGVIVTIIITKAADKVAPTEPIVVKQYTDTVKIVHEYNIPDNLNNDTIQQQLENRIKNLELLNNYDAQIKRRITQIQKSEGLSPNLIITQKVDGITQKGYTYASSSSYFTAECPDMLGKYLDINMNFINPAVTADIAFLRISIYGFDDPNKHEPTTYVLEDFYEVKHENNLIRINNDFSKGKYEILFGFMFKNELKEKYPKFYFKKCFVIKP